MRWKTRVLEILARECSLSSARRETKVEAHFQGVSPVGKWMSWLDASSLDRCSEISASKDSQNLERASGLAVGRHELLFECLWLRSSACCEGVNRSESDVRHLIPSNQSINQLFTATTYLEVEVEVEVDEEEVVAVGWIEDLEVESLRLVVEILLVVVVGVSAR